MGLKRLIDIAMNMPLVNGLTNQFSSVDIIINLNIGIELALAQMIMEAHRGKILFERTGDKRGSVKMIFASVSEGSGDPDSIKTGIEPESQDR